MTKGFLNTMLFMILATIHLQTGESMSLPSWPTITVATNGFILNKNDLLTTLDVSAQHNNVSIIWQYETDLSSAIAGAPSNSTIFYVVSSRSKVNSYPDTLNAFSLDDYTSIMSKNLKAYIEYPSCVALHSKRCHPVNRTLLADYERTVIVTDSFGDTKNLSLIASGQTTFAVVNNLTKHIEKRNCEMLTVISKVAGYDYAIFGLDKTLFYPLLFQCGDPSSGMIVYSMNGMSQYTLSRYHPELFVASMVRYVLETLIEPHSFPLIIFPQPRIQAEGTLVKNAISVKNTMQRALDWLFNARLFPTGDVWCDAGTCFAPTPVAGIRTGNGTFGMLEGFGSGVNVTGGQSQSNIIRMDCHGEVAGALSFTASATPPNKQYTLTRNLLDYMARRGQVQSPDMSIAQDSAHGILLWGTNAPIWNASMYCDDNARAILGALVATSNLYRIVPESQIHSLEDHVILVVKAIFAQFRLTSTNGYCPESVSIDSIRWDGWHRWYDGGSEMIVPHYTAWIWASYLYACQVTNFGEMCSRTEKGIEILMNSFYAGKVVDTQRPTTEYARTLLQVALLLRVDVLNPTPAARNLHKKWLYYIAEQLIALQDVTGEIGTIRAKFPSHPTGAQGPPRSNAEYGTREAPLNQENTDPVSDQLYVTSFSLLGLHEAYMVTGDDSFRHHRDLLAHFLGISQVHVNDDELSYLAGSWFRAFDYNWMEYFASGSDIGWGPLSMESGWTHGEIMMALGLISRNESIWATSPKFENVFRKVFLDLLPKFGFNFSETV